MPQGVEGRDVALQNGLAAALAARREQSEEAMLAKLLAFPLMEAWRGDRVLTQLGGLGNEDRLTGPHNFRGVLTGFEGQARN